VEELLVKQKTNEEAYSKVSIKRTFTGALIILNSGVIHFLNGF